MEEKGSEEFEKKGVRIKLKTDPKQDPRTVKAGGKSALKKDPTPTPDPSATSQQRDSQQSSTGTPAKRPSEQNSPIGNEAQETLKKVAEQKKSTDNFVREDTSSTKLKIISPPSKPDAVKQEGSFSKGPVPSQETVSNKALEKTAIVPKEGENSISNVEVNVTKEENRNESKNSGGNEIIVPSVHDDDDDARDTKSTRISVKVSKKSNEEVEQSTVDGKSENNEATGKQMRTDNYDIRLSDISTTSISNSIIEQGSTSQRADFEEGSTTAKETPVKGMETNSLVETKDTVGKKLHEDGNSTDKGIEDSVKNDPDKRKKKNDGNDGSRIQLERSTGSEDVKINELKKRVRSGQVFVVRADPDCYTVKWAEKRKIFAYKVGSNNTTRFSTMLIETVEQLERASVRHPSIISELTHTTAGAKGSLLSTYFAGAVARRSIKDNLIREAGTNTDDQNGFESRQKSPDYNFFAKDHISPDGEIFGGVTPNQPKTADPIQSNNYNYPFLTDYDVNHERKGHK